MPTQPSAELQPATRQRMTLGKLADAITVVVGVAVLAALGARYLSSGPVAPGVGERLDPSVGIDVAAGSQALVLALQSNCQFCQESMPFYRRVLVERNSGELQIVVAAPSHDVGIGEYLAQEGLHPDDVVFVERGQVPVAGTPTLLVVDASGMVTHAWIGRLDADQEAEVMSVLFG